MKEFSRENKYLRAKARVECLKKFYGNVTSYVLVVSFLAAINYYLDEWRHAWFLWVAFGWGIGILFHAIRTFNLNPFFGRAWEERKIRELMREEDEIKRWE